MSSKLINLYTYLVDNQKHHLQGWYNEYKEIVEKIERIKNSDDIEVGINAEYTSYDNFIGVLFANKSNGVASNGQSTLSDENRKILLADVRFKEIIYELIKVPDYENWQKLRKLWKEVKGGNNPLLTNRAVAACSLTLSTTVDEPKFWDALKWLEAKKYVENINSENWYLGNLALTNQLWEALKNVKNIDRYWLNIFVWQIYTNISNPFSLKKQIVKYGAPGTGKTYMAKQTAELQFNIWKEEFDNDNSYSFDDAVDLVQFHSSYSYEDFMEGLRPVPDKEGKTQLALQNGIFKSLCIDAGKWEKDIAIHLPNKKWNELIISDIQEIEDKLDEEHWKFIFNQPDKNQFLKDVVPPYFLIIDEINRAELSRVFGELMYCLEYRGIKGAIKTQYAHLNNSENGMIKLGGGYKFFVPHNVYILATMNTIDRSVESFDFAMRRRFKWEEVNPDCTLLKYHLIENYPNWVDLAKNLESLNSAIMVEPILGKSYCIGHAYLWNLPYSSKLTVAEVRRNIWKDSIQSLLEEYLRGTGRENLINTFSKSFGL